MSRCITSVVTVWLVGIAVTFPTPTVHAAIPPFIQIQGVARDGGGNPLADGVYQMQFSIFDDPFAGTLIWSETEPGVAVSGGMFTVFLGAVQGLGDSVFSSTIRWLEITVDANPPLPRIRLTTSPFAFRVATVDGATGGMVSGDVTITGKATIGSGHTNTGVAAFVTGQGNIAAGDWSTVAGGESNAAHGQHNAIGGGFANITDNYGSTIGGGRYNWADAGSTIGGGWINAAAGLYSTIGGGAWNRTWGQFSTVGGGGGNTIDDSNSASGDYAVIGGGHRNFAHGEANTIGGGVDNVTDNYWTTIGGGTHNWAGAGAAIGGGNVNAAGGLYSSIGGGSWNRAWGQFAVVSGGGGELITDSNSAIGNYSTVSGGRMNVASGPGSAVAGGWRNTASGRFAFVAGGVDNIAREKLSFAAGRQALAAHIGAFVWADSLTDTVSSPGINTFTVRASGGIWLGTNSTPSIPATDFLNTSTGAHLTSGGVWTNACDQDAKENFTEVDRDDLLRRIGKLSIMRWNYRAEDDSITHIGPVAQDFRAVFNVGTDDKSISTIDPAGISLAAIQALSEKNERLEREVTELRKQISEILQELGTMHE